MGIRNLRRQRRERELLAETAALSELRREVHLNEIRDALADARELVERASAQVVEEGRFVEDPDEIEPDPELANDLGRMISRVEEVSGPGRQIDLGLARQAGAVSSQLDAYREFWADPKSAHGWR